MPVPRDNQRQRLYDAEHEAFPDWNGNRLGSIEQTQTWINARVTSARFFQARWGEVAIQARIKTSGRATGHRYGAWGGHVCLPPWSRNPPTVLHEIAHVLCPDHYANHGPEFCAILLVLVDHVMGREHASALRAAMSNHRVRYRGGAAAVPKPIKAVTTQAAVTARKRRQAAAPVPNVTIREAVAAIRQMAAQGHFGAAGAKPRIHALATARAMERALPTTLAARTR